MEEINIPYEDYSYEYYKRCNACSRMVPCFIIDTDEPGRERCPYCNERDLGLVERSVLYSLEAYLRDQVDFLQ